MQVFVWISEEKKTVTFDMDLEDHISDLAGMMFEYLKKTKDFYKNENKIDYLSRVKIRKCNYPYGRVTLGNILRDYVKEGLNCSFEIGDPNYGDYRHRGRIKSIMESFQHMDKEELTESLLHYSGCAGMSEVVEELVKRGADVNARGDYNKTPLMHSMASNETEVDFLLKNGAKTDLTDNSGNTAWGLAIEAYGVGAMSALLKHKVSIANDPKKDAILNWAVSFSSQYYAENPNPYFETAKKIRRAYNEEISDRKTQISDLAEGYKNIPLGQITVYKVPIVRENLAIFGSPVTFLFTGNTLYHAWLIIDLVPVQGVTQKTFSAQFMPLNGGGKENSGLILSGHDTQEDAIQAGIDAVGAQYGKVSTGSKVVFNKKYYNCGSRAHLGYRFTLRDFMESMRKKK